MALGSTLHTDALRAEASSRLQLRKEDVPELHKTRLCRFAQRGHCKHGAACTFAHANDELTSVPDFTNTKICTSVVRGRQCTHKDCPFAHSYNELRPHPRSGGLGNRRKEKGKGQGKGQGAAGRPQTQGAVLSSPPGLSWPPSSGRPFGCQLVASSSGSPSQDGELRDAFMDEMSLGILTPDVANVRNFPVGAVGASGGSRNSVHSQPVSPARGYANDWIDALGAAWPMASGSIQSTDASLPMPDDTLRGSIETAEHSQNSKGRACAQQMSPTSQSCRTLSCNQLSSSTGSDTTQTPPISSPIEGAAPSQTDRESGGAIAAQIQELKSMLSIMSLHDAANITRLED